MTIIPVHIPLYVAYIHDPRTHREGNVRGVYPGSYLHWLDYRYAECAVARMHRRGFMCEVRELSLQTLGDSNGPKT